MILYGLETISWDSDDLQKLQVETKVISSLPTMQQCQWPPTTAHLVFVTIKAPALRTHPRFFGDTSSQA